MYDADRLDGRALKGGEERVEETGIPVRQIEARWIGLEEVLETVLLGPVHGRLAVFEQLFRRHPGLLRHGAFKDIRDRGEPQHGLPGLYASRRENRTEQRQHGDYGQDEYQHSASFHFSFQTLRYS